ncbi:sugar O-acetyltransferase [Entomospira culicis]|uniref:Acetyltransferase n=1 Tax=Entomospira culicis TaxID=2719989 RepID=A0A968GI38_9SPIO|nr:sugar O-acetyltransferase [Entomospira culicis]NIZ19175.1 sugar O-acetyltransferase [Entomospira culicis]NIZ69389.1 sugar O-acetyltransferase [Entomospira culicis]WDI36506.1 sugar O-acetyltransferase [Entomospira culicis]WDI38132.1 sugar O-acetyltransferase [Entomospira culicis]
MKSQWQKIADGELYDPNDPALIEGRAQCKAKLHQLNHQSPELPQLPILETLLAKADAKTYLVAPFYCDYGHNIRVGSNFFANSGCVMLDGAPITIGDNVMIAPNVGLHTATHPLDAKTRMSGLEYAFPITIEDNVWIGAGSVILPGVTLGKNCVVGAGSVVTKSVPANMLVVGNPARVVREIDNNN